MCCLGPLPLQNIQSTFKQISIDLYQINVTWDLPQNIPDFYEVTLNLISGRGNFVSQNVSGVSYFYNYVFGCVRFEYC